MVGGKLKKFVLLFVTLLICGIYIFISDSVVESVPETKTETETVKKLRCFVNGKEGIGDTRILAQKVDKKNYLFLPSGMNLSALRIHFSCPLGKWVTFHDQIIDGHITIDVLNQGTYNETEKSYRLVFRICDAGGIVGDYKLRVMESSGIPSVFLVSENEEENRSWIESTQDHANVAKARVYEMNEDGILICRQKADKLRIRGNFTADAAKKAYQFKLAAKEDMLQIKEPGKSFALLANAYDNTLQHNTVTYQLGKELGLSDSPDCRPVDVYYDGKYAGNYLLTELPDISKRSIAIDKEGSYLMQIDYSHYKDKEHYLRLSNGMYVVLEEPGDISYEQTEYVRQIWEELIETIDYGGIHPANGKTIEDYLDVESYARYYLIQQFSKNPDGFVSSAYCYIPSHEDKIYFGGLWDFDLGYGIVNAIDENGQSAGLTEPLGLYPDNTGSDISTIPVVSQKIKEIYENELRGIIEDILLGDEGQQGEYVKSLEGYNEEIYASQRMNYMLWDFNMTGLTIPFLTYEDSVSYFIDFVRDRHAWLFHTIESWGGCGETDEVSFLAEEPVVGMPLEADIKLSDKWCGGKIISCDFLEQDAWFEASKEYRCRVNVISQYGSSFPEHVRVASNAGKIESVTAMENGMLEIILNMGTPKETGTVYEGVDYAPVYDKEYYLASYPSAAEQAGTEDEAVLKYFITEGMKNGQKGCADFDVDVYIERYPILKGLDYPDVYMHYLREGISRGWSGRL